MITLDEAIKGMLDAESRLSSRQAVVSPTIISEQMYRLGQYASATEKLLGDAEEAYEIEWAKKYTMYTEPYALSDENGNITYAKSLSATAAKQRADVDTAAAKGNIKRLSRYVSSCWKIHTGAMARINHLNNEIKSGGI